MLTRSYGMFVLPELIPAGIADYPAGRTPQADGLSLAQITDLLEAGIEGTTSLTDSFMEDVMNITSQLTDTCICSSRTLSNLFHLPKRNLGCAILVAAIEDYLSIDEQAYASAAQFLYPASSAYQEHYDWVVAMAAGVNRTWLRDELDRAKAKWDRERCSRKLQARLEAAVQSRIPA
jgi:hypothetical protein